VGSHNATEDEGSSEDHYLGHRGLPYRCCASVLAVPAPRL
jgi:hypothetical protein